MIKWLFSVNFDWLDCTCKTLSCTWDKGRDKGRDKERGNGRDKGMDKESDNGRDKERDKGSYK